MVNEIEMYKGDNETFEVTVYDSDDPATRVIVPLVGDEPVYFTVRLKIDDTTFTIQKKSADAGGSDSEIKITDAPNGILEIYLVPADTLELNATRYVYDVQITYSSEVKTIIKSRYHLEEHVTKVS